VHKSLFTKGCLAAAEKYYDAGMSAKQQTCAACEAGTKTLLALQNGYNVKNGCPSVRISLTDVR